MATLTLKDITKTFGSIEVIQGIDMAVRDGEFIVIVGPSGCGKSTLLRMIAGLETTTSGQIDINDVRVNEQEPMERNIAMVFQTYALYPHMSVFDNMAYSLKIAGLSKSEIAARVNEAADLLQVRDYLDRKPKQLSGGQRQRVAMGRAIVRQPELFLFDEPLSNLDAKLRVQMRLEIKKLQRKLGVTSVYVTHDQVEAMTMGDRLLVLNGGVVEQFGTPIELYTKPASVFVAQFIGSPSMNMFKGTADGKSITLENRTAFSSPHDFNGDVWVGLRPEHMVHDEKGPLSMIVHAQEQLGSQTLLHGVLQGTNTLVVASIPGIFDATISNEPMRFSYADGHLHLFDRSTDKSVSFKPE